MVEFFEIFITHSEVITLYNPMVTCVKKFKNLVLVLKMAILRDFGGNIVVEL